MISLSPNINGAFFKAIGVLDSSKNIAVSISGGSDSDIVVDFISRSIPLDNVSFVFFDTGLEYEATRAHLDYLEDRYKINIDRIKPRKSIIRCVKEYGSPFLSKYISENIYRLQKHDFDFTDERGTDELLENYSCTGPCKWFTNAYKPLHSMYNIARKKNLREFLMSHPPEFPISNKCCTYTKKKVAEEYNRKNDIEISVIGIRKAEGGARILNQSCYVSSDKGPDRYFPLLHFTDEDKRIYNAHFKIRNSDCYTKYGLKRTGCVGCPFSKDYLREAYATRDFEPKIYRVAQSVFGKSYDYTSAYLRFREYGSENIRQGTLEEFA